jgi:hypothetical protein
VRDQQCIGRINHYQVMRSDHGYQALTAPHIALVAVDHHDITL